MKKFILVVPARGHYLGLSRQAIDVLLREAGAGVSERADMRLAVAEACNLIRLLSRPRAEKVISINGVCRHGQLMLSVEDSSRGAEGRHAVDRLENSRLPDTGGYSVDLLSSLTENVRFTTGLAGGVRIEIGRPI